MKKGIFCISIDLELLWGRSKMPNSHFFEKRIKKERLVIDKILKLFNKYSIPATWAVVGKMNEPGSSLYSGKDILTKIKALGNQELASHSYSHQVFTEIKKDLAISEFNKNKKYSFVFPKNKVAYLKELKKAGFVCYRGKDPNEYELLIPRIPPVFNPSKNRGLVNIPGSMYFVSGRGVRKYIPKGLRYLKVRLGIERAIKLGKIFHIWFHPMDFVDDSEKLLSDFEKILKYANDKRMSGKLEILTMENICKNYLRQ